MEHHYFQEISSAYWLAKNRSREAVYRRVSEVLEEKKGSPPSLKVEAGTSLQFGLKWLASQSRDGHRFEAAKVALGESNDGTKPRCKHH